MENFGADMIFIDASLERVFVALVDPNDVLEWLSGEEAEIGAWKDGVYRVRRADGCLSGIVDSVDEKVGISLRDCFWERDGDEGRQRCGPTRIRFQLQPQDNGVWVTVRHDDLDAAPGGDWHTFAASMRKQWVEATVALKRHVEGI